MAEIILDGDIANITERQQEFIKTVIDELGFNGSKATFTPLGQAGDNYLANVKRIVVEKGEETISMIVKVAPTIEQVRQMTNTALIFRNEHIMYTEVLPKFLKLQQDGGIPKEELFGFPKCYGSLNEDCNEVILLEDLNTTKYTMLDRFASLSDKCVRSVLKNFAAYHSLSYVLKHKDPGAFESFRSNLVDIWALMKSFPQSKVYFQQFEADVLAMIDDPEIKSKVRDKVADLLDLSYKFSRSEFNSKYSVIQHGDAWVNNVMFRFEGDTPNGGPIESMLIDYQQSKNSNPACDILYFIFNSTDFDTRTNNFYDWIDYYHKELDNALSNFNLKANFIYPRDVLDADIKRYGKLMFGFSVLLASFLTKNAKDAAKMKESMEGDDLAQILETVKLTQSASDSISLFKTRVLGLIDSFMQYGLL